MTFTYVTDSKHRFYLDKILTQAGITDVNTKTQINVILSCWSFVVACGGSYLLDFVGRRKQALGSVMGMIVSLYAVGGMIKSEFQKFRSSAVSPYEINVEKLSETAPTNQAYMARSPSSSCSKASMHSQSLH